MLHRWTPLFFFFFYFNGGLPKLLILSLCTGWIINSRQTNYTDEITAVVKDEQWRLSVLLLLLKLACVGYEQENKKKANREQIVPYFENTLWQRGSASSCVWRHFTTVCLFTAMWDLKKKKITETWWMELRIYLCKYVIKNYCTLQFDLDWSVNQTVASWTAYERGTGLDISAFSVCHIFWWFISLDAFRV